MNATDSFLKAFAKITGSGDFHSSGTAPFFLPRLSVEGLGELAFPLPAAQAKELISLAEEAPYGRGTETVLDGKVRRCWQIDAGRISSTGSAWREFVARTVERVREDLGITGAISAVPYKLLIYGKGGHFRAHRDTEKLDAMFGTLIIALPSAHEGGRLLIRHDGREVEVDFSRDHHAFQHAALFADCEHEVEPVRSGFRCCLVYNLRLDKGDADKLNLSLTAQARTLHAPLDELGREREGDLSAVLLEHSYTEANLSLGNLKGHDQSRARALFAAAREAGLVAHLVLVTFRRMGELEGGYGYGRRRRYYDDDPEDEAMGEVYEESLTIGPWRNEADRPAAFGEFLIGADALIGTEKIGEGEPDEKEAEGYTGNAGCTMEYWYRRAAVVVWRVQDHESILCRYDFRAACDALAVLASRGKAGPEFQRLGEALIERYHASPESGIHTGGFHGAASHPFPVILGAIARTASHDLLARFLDTVDSEHFLLCDAALWRKLFDTFGLEPFRKVCQNLLQGGAKENRRAIFQFLDALRKRRDGEASAGLVAGRVAALDPAQPAPNYGRGESVPGDREEARILLLSSHLLKSDKDRRNAAAFLRADGSLAYVRKVLGPVLLEQPVKKCLEVKNSLAPEIFAFAMRLLADEVARPLKPYPDWTRPCPRQGPYAGGVVSELLAFMADPAAETHRFARRQAERTALEDFIQTHSLDLDCTTITKGSPHTLVCKKNSNSYRDALARRAKDEELLRQLSA